MEKEDMRVAVTSLRSSARFTMGLLVLLLGCQDKRAGAPERAPPLVETKVEEGNRKPQESTPPTVQSSEATSFAEGGPDASLAGVYYRGDGRGLNLHLSLGADGTFRCGWTGCLGDYESCAGSWRRQGTMLRVSVASSSGMFDSRPLGDLEISGEGELAILVPPSKGRP
jgi:hypothetical protein